MLLFYFMASILGLALAQDPSTCCQKGYAKGATVLVSDISCEPDVSISSSFTGFMKIMCTGFYKQCCASTAASQHCLLGEQLALANQICLASNKVGGGNKRSCCECCKRGTAHGNAGGSCKQKQNDPMCNSAFRSCCKKTKKTPTSTPTTKKPSSKTCSDIKCDQKTTRGCNEGSNGPKCLCKVGYAPNNDGVTCVDIDECIGDKHRCPARSYCLNTVGDYRCLSDCPHPNYQVPKVGVCEDINECTKRLHNCRKNFKCVNTVGWYDCQRVRCDKGYKFVNGYCEDIDECSNDPNICGAHGVCRNANGNYYCDCRQGYQINSDTKKCEDVNECKINRAYCNYRCVNTEGSYRCTCPHGYETRGQYCYDVNECRTNPCAKGSYCFNTFGSYACINQSCPNRFFVQRSSKNNIPYCQKTPCHGNNECKSNPLQSTKRVAYRFYSNMAVRGFIFNYWTSFDSRYYRVDTRLVKGNEDQTFYIDHTSDRKLQIYNQKSVTGPRNFHIVMHTDVQTRGRLTWRYEYDFYVYVGAHPFG